MLPVCAYVLNLPMLTMVHAGGAPPFLYDVLSKVCGLRRAWGWAVDFRGDQNYGEDFKNRKLSTAAGIHRLVTDSRSVTLAHVRSVVLNFMESEAESQ